MSASMAIRQEDLLGLQAEVRKRTEQYMALWSEHRIAEHSQLLTEDADLVNVVGVRFHGRPAIQALHEQLHRTIFAKSESRIVEMSVVALSPSIALVHAQWEMKGMAKMPGWNVPEPRTGWMTLVWVNQEGKWLVRAMHNTDAIEVPDLPKS
jgi:uncharacterized protein (TIGR02246 family)